ncbi:hypothetical protein [Paenibacillus polymyxa]|uniref:Uncharacterized protein n=1 Tax=Paenibacillus polymyxa TaxID=1406 RepID=A0ABX2ZGE9_PAEPO|nr:hypothetical protein [Paenibacillus polymyxa]ODA09258.1 hypothetical protein A7312_26760 [Paenibacillus polymyxa]
MNKFTSLHHLNLFIHMGMDYPLSSRVYPYFYKKGFKIKFISFSLPIPQTTRKNVIKEINSTINTSVVPELIYENIENNELLLVECKLLDIVYDVENRDNKQAFGYLSLNSRELFDFLGEDRKESESRLLYSVLDDYKDSYDQVLNKISSVVKKAANEHLAYDVSSIKVEDDQISLCIKNDKDGQIGEFLITSDPLLLIIPLDPEVNMKDEYGRQAIEESLRMTIASKICPFVGFRDIEFNLEEICKEIIPVWEAWSKTPKAKVRELIKYYMRQLSKELEKKGLIINFQRGIYSIDKTDIKTGEKVRSFFRSSGSNHLASKSLDTLEQMVIEEWIGELG